MTVEQHATNGAGLERRLDEVIADFLVAVDGGQSPDPQEWLCRFPDLAPQLARFFADQQRIDNLLTSFRPSTARADASTETTASSTPDATQAVADSGATLSYFGDYELLGEIARGGMGVVYKARQRSLNRTLALKMILAGRLASAAEVQRFRSEAEAAAQLDHPHIVPIYEVGEHGGQHYFTMKFIEGGNLAQHALRFRVNLRSAARLLATVARAVHHAHQRGVLHRDLKPANILLDSQEQPYLTDFGLARRLNGGPGLTRPSTAVGTPSYMAPEQATGPGKEVTTAADVYSLGAILYELLTGRPPFLAETPLEILWQAVDREPERPQALNPAVPADLETICLKCLAREPGRRYGSAEDLADELERFLNGEAIRARPARPLARLGRWCRRRPLVALLAAALLLSVVLGSGLAIWQWWQANEHARRADRERIRAEESFRQAHQAVNDFCARVNESPARGLETVRRELLEAALPYYERFLQERGQDPALRAELADTHFRIATITAAIGPAPRALDAYERALDIYQELLRDAPSDVLLRKSLAQTQSRLGVLQAATGRAAAALSSYQEAHALYEQLRAEAPGDPGLDHATAALCNNLGNLQRRSGHLAEALNCLAEARVLQEKLVRNHPGQSHYQENLAATYLNLAALSATLGEKHEAMALYEQARDVQERLVRASARSLQGQQNLALTYRLLGNGFSQDRHYDRALESVERGHALLERLARDNPGINSLQSDLSASHRELGHVHRLSRRKDFGLAHYQKALDLMEALVRLNPAVTEFQNDLAKCNFDKAGALDRLGRPAEAIDSYHKALDLRGELVRANPEHLDYRNDLALTLGNLGGTLWNLGRREEGLAAVRQALEEHRLTFAQGPRVARYRKYLSQALAAVADMETRRGGLDEAVAATQERHKLWPGNAAELYAVARQFALVAAQKTPDEPSGAGAARRYADLAMDALREAAAAGFDDSERLRTDPAWDALRTRADFKNLR
jgi:serine/threonine-protein kinase